MPFSKVCSCLDQKVVLKGHEKRKVDRATARLDVDAKLLNEVSSESIIYSESGKKILL